MISVLWGCWSLILRCLGYILNTFYLSTCLFLPVSLRLFFSAVPGNHPDSVWEQYLISPLTPVQHNGPEYVFLLLSIPPPPGAVMLSGLVNIVTNGFSCLPQLKPLWKVAEPSPGGFNWWKRLLHRTAAGSVNFYSSILHFSIKSGGWTGRESDREEERAGGSLGLSRLTVPVSPCNDLFIIG